MRSLIDESAAALGGEGEPRIACRADASVVREASWGKQVLKKLLTEDREKRNESSTRIKIIDTV